MLAFVLEVVCCCSFPFCLPFGTICTLFVYFGTPFSSIFNEKIRIKEGERVLIKKNMNIEVTLFVKS